ncbi:pentapeptide repeat-containing protein [Oricola sp.]|uniref:pentapeptide repeat-containing protein n=1 Tax=Oricola sp. TaxID=1979950 RepID=UPI003BA8423B
MDTLIFGIPVSVTDLILWLAILVVAILLIVSVARRVAAIWRSSRQPSQSMFWPIKKPPVLHERPFTNALVWFAVILSPFWLALIVLTISGTFSLWFTEPPPGETQALAYRVHYLAVVGLMTALAALIGAPLAVHRLYTVERQTRAQEEGLVTDRINKAVEGLGAEKTVKQVHETPHYRSDEDGAWLRDDEGDPMPALGPDGEPIVDRQVVELSVPNLEVRIGAIYALERIARLNPDEHIQIMEILTAYIRENAPASSASALPQPPDRFEGKNDDGDEWDDAFEAWRAEHRAAVGEHRPREDIQIALTVIGRRGDKQIQLERGAWVPFGNAVPDWPDWQADADGKPTREYEDAVADWEKSVEEWQQTEPAYRLDLRDTDLTGADMADGDFALARLDGARMQGADLSGAQMQGAGLTAARMQGAELREAQMQGADLSGARMQAADLTGARMQGAYLREAQMQGANLSWAQMQGAVLRLARMQGAYLRGARMQGADLSWAQMQGAYLREAQMQGAKLFEARMQGADLVEARMQGAYLGRAHMQGAYLGRAHMQGAGLREARMQGAYLGRAHMQGAVLWGAEIDTSTAFSETVSQWVSLKAVAIPPGVLTQEQINSAFGDASTGLPDDLQRPDHWPQFDMDWEEYYEEWEKWRADPDGYAPPEPPSDDDVA